MKRSDINGLIEQAIRYCEAMNFKLPPFAFWTLDDWRRKGGEYQEVLDNQLGWDVTDFGSGDYHRIGLMIFVLRNGKAGHPLYTKPYCEKILIQEEGQVLPLHFHWNKMEDIINRGGGNLVVELYNAISDSEPDRTNPVTVTMDGRRLQLPAGGRVIVRPGESITLLQHQFHKFWAEPGMGKVLLGEVSMVSDEAADNNFIENSGRLPVIEEDEAPRHLIFSDYAKFL